MPNITSMKPTDAELEILQVIWLHGPVSVRFVNDELNHKKRVGYTTTLKLMQIMREKGLLMRSEDGRKHVYNVVLKEKETKNLLLDKFVKTAFGGSAMDLVMQALGNHQTTPDELEELKALIDKIERDSQ
jgi:BlaI family penicillinase repressor